MAHAVRCTECNVADSMEIVLASQDYVDMQCDSCGFFFTVETSGTPWYQEAIQMLLGIFLERSMAQNEAQEGIDT